MAPSSKSRSSTSKASSAPKSALGFSSSKKGVTAAGGKAAAGSKKKKAADEENVTAATAAASTTKKTKSSIAGLYPRLYKEALRNMGPPIHREEMHDDVEIILRVFDACEDYGPSSRISRLERYERAERLGLEPDPEIGEILRSEEGRTRPVYANSVFQI